MMRSIATRALFAISALLAGGCATAADESIIGDWSVEQLDGAPLVAGSTVTMRFGPDGRVAGKASCNRYGSVYRIAGDTISFSGAMVTKMACPPALMRQEARFLSIFDGEAHWSIDRGAMTISAGNGVIVNATRATGR